MKLRAVFIGGKEANINRVYGNAAMKRLNENAYICDTIINKQNLEQYREQLLQAEIAFSTWGMPAFTENEIEKYMPNLKVLFYAAGSVQSFARPFLNCGTRVVSAWEANAVPVAEYAAAQIVLANKGFFQTALKSKTDYKAARKYYQAFPGNYSTRVGILGAGKIGTKVIYMLKDLAFDILVFDPFLSDERAHSLGVRSCSLQEVFSTCQTISNHLANKPEIAGVLNRDLFSLMLPNATFINTGRGAQVVENDLADALKEYPDRTAVLDVTYPEPPAKDSELYKLENVILTPHIAGSDGNEVERMAEYMVDEMIRYKNGELLKYEVTLDMLDTMA